MCRQLAGCIAFSANRIFLIGQVQRVIKKFKKTGSIIDIKFSGHPLASQSQENVSIMRQSVNVGLWKSNCQMCPQQLPIMKSLYAMISCRRSASDYLQDSVNTRTQTNRPFEAQEFVKWMLQYQELDSNLSKRHNFVVMKHY